MAGKLVTPRKKKLTVEPKSAHISVREGPDGAFDVYGFYVNEYRENIKPDVSSVAHRVVLELMRHCHTLGKNIKNLAVSDDPNDFLSDPPSKSDGPALVVVPGSGATN
jgi:hypothetical protein